ncbi:MAG: CoA transferase [Oscillibacter sp.]|nr:CoA transferase [Oscillibacter sp.]
MIKILDDVRVLDLSRYISGPSCCRILADMGAEVIKVEKAGHGDEGRHCGPFHNGSSLYFPAYNRNKKSITIDFRSEKGKAVLRGLIEKSDVIVENFRAGTMAKMGLGFEEIQKINPGAILVSINGFGQFGPDSKRPAYDQIISYRAHLYSNPAEGEFHLGPDLMSDTIMGMNAATAAILALYDRKKTGKGQWLDCCMLTSSVGSWPIALADYAMNGDRGPYLIDAPNGIFKTKDGYVQLTSGPQPMFMRLREIIEDPIIQDEKYIDGKNRIQDADLLVERVAVWMKEHTCAEVDEIMDTNGITCGKVCTWQDVLDDRQLAYRDDIIHLPVKNCGTVPYAKFPVHFSGHEYLEDTPVPELGENNIDILTSLLGMTPEEAEAHTK